MDMQAGKTSGISTLWVAILAVSTAVLRVLPTFHVLPFNFNPVGGLAIFCGARYRSRWAYAIPSAIMFSTDIFLWAIGKGEEYSPRDLSRPFVYFSFLVYVWIGRGLATTRNPLLIGTGAILGSVQFFVITNFQSWIDLIGRPYTPDLNGLLTAYVRGIPFAQGTFIGDLVFTGAFFGLFACLQSDEKAATPETISA